MEIKQKIIVNEDIIKKLLDIIIELRKTSNQINLAKAGEEICIKILGKKCMVKWHKRLRQKNINNYKVIKKGLIYKIK